MNTRKAILYSLLASLGVVLMYNFFIVPRMVQYRGHMGMGMHERMYNNYNYYIDLRYIFIIIIIVAGFILYELLKLRDTVKKCSICGNEIESEQWKVCPKCGTPVNEGKRGSK